MTLIVDPDADAGPEDIHPVAAVILACTEYAAHANILADRLEGAELTRDECEQVLASVGYATTASTRLVRAVTPRPEAGDED
ncbi:hypothetical protein [Streptosporangium lutulentum]|uniref:Carboxymuconolactone decarboxylase-like domain-containing protein n=1 Tax=Streptosporangium lutulentum TaxID=1461250 RepID=A0ABT9QSG3_9ACTN|nr:hypothetical protein [Streptosporangium lutulentum]MDP9849228.1 hypothetical protein [Streptosporangium lutulentum]